MIRHWITIILFFASSSLFAQEENTAFYLLRTGYVLDGSATFDGKHYVVQTPFGTMSLPVQNVEFVGKSRMDIYLYKRNSVDPANYNALVRLAEWCVSNGYIEEGIAEYQRAGQVAPNAVCAGIAGQRLDTLRQMNTATAVQESPAPPTETAAELSVSRLAFENFTRQVQPILVNRCLSTDCHGTHSEQQFKLGIPQERLGSTSRRNLQAVLPYIDRSTPLESAFLLALTAPHGGARRALSVEPNTYVQIVQWVQQVAKELPPEQRTEKKSELPEYFRQAILQAERTESGRKTQQKEADPLDPAVFNEKYHRRVKERVP